MFHLLDLSDNDNLYCFYSSILKNQILIFSQLCFKYNKMNRQVFILTLVLVLFWLIFVVDTNSNDIIWIWLHLRYLRQKASSTHFDLWKCSHLTLLSKDYADHVLLFSFQINIFACLGYCYDKKKKLVVLLLSKVTPNINIWSCGWFLPSNS